MTSITPNTSSDTPKTFSAAPANASSEAVISSKSVSGKKHFRIKIWDAPVRIFHGLLLISFAGAYVTNKLGVQYFKYHVWFGYLMIVLIGFRVLWGIWGSYHARFKHFVRSPLVAWRYGKQFLTGKEASTFGHNPLGAIMVVFLLLTLLVQSVTGLFSNDEIFNNGALYGYISSELSLTLTAIHKDLFYWIFAAVVLHVAAVIFHVAFKRENLISAMISGYRLSSVPQSIEELKARAQVDLSEKSIVIRAVILVALVAAALYGVIVTAPEPESFF